jgi:hypothetical protein
MERPINVFWDFIRNLKDLVVSVKIGNSKADPFGSVLEQLSETEFKVEDTNGNQGVCKLVEKQTDDLDSNEMSLLGFVLSSSTFVYISKLVRNIMEDFENNKFSWDVENDSTTNILILTGKI